MAQCWIREILRWQLDQRHIHWGNGGTQFWLANLETRRTTKEHQRAEFITPHLNPSVCLWDLREPKRKEEAWTVEIVEIVETGYLSEGHIACLIPICKVCFIFWGVAVETEASVWETLCPGKILGMWNVCQRVFLTKSPLSKPIKHEARSIAKRSCSSEGAKESLTRQLTRCLHIVICEDLCLWHVLGIRNHF